MRQAFQINHSYESSSNGAYNQVVVDFSTVTRQIVFEDILSE